MGEPGVSYLIRAGATTILFDSGRNFEEKPRSTLLQNAEVLKADLQHVDGIVISQLHADHVEGLRSQRRHIGDELVVTAAGSTLKPPGTDR